MRNNLYSPYTGEHIITETKAPWMKEAPVDAPSYDKKTQECFFKDGKWEVSEAKDTEKEQRIEAAKAKLFADMDELDLKSIRATRAILLALAQGKKPEQADIDKLNDLEKEMKLNRTKAMMAK